jgi:hypothetical protein
MGMSTLLLTDRKASAAIAANGGTLTQGDSGSCDHWSQWYSAAVEGPRVLLETHSLFANRWPS